MMSGSSRRSGVPLWILEVAGILLLAYAIAQPAILRSFHVAQGEDLKISDVISVFATVFGIIAASTGVLVYTLAKSKLEESNRFSVERAGVSAAYNATVLAWNQLEPLLTGPVGDDVTKALCWSPLKLAKEACRFAQTSLDQSGPDFAKMAAWQDTIWTTMAFLLACDVYVRGALPSDSAAIEALSLLSKVQFVTDLESAAWVKLLCHPTASADWRDGRTLARRIVEPGDILTRLRYEAAFGPDFFV
jgi:hypothetical protein